MRIGILGSRGIPNRYGGFEQFASYLAPGLVEQGHEVFVYCSHYHPYTESTYQGVQLIRCWDPEPRIGSAGQFIYDLTCILDSRKRQFDILYQLGYTTSGIWQGLMPRKPILVTNMDGLEWTRAKYSGPLKHFLRWSERAVVRRSDALVADAIPIQEYLRETFAAPSTYLAYGADLFLNPDIGMLKPMGLQPYQYLLLIARMQPDNHIEMAIQGVLQSNTTLPLLIIGNTANRHGKYLVQKYTTPQIQFLGGIYDEALLDNLRYYAALYFHGHSAGGTNPSLLEAMASSARICAHDNRFNRSVLGKGACYYENAESLGLLIQETLKDSNAWEQRVIWNRQKIQQQYTKAQLIDQYTRFFAQLTS